MDNIENTLLDIEAEEFLKRVKIEKGDSPELCVSKMGKYIIKLEMELFKKGWKIT